MNKLCLSAKRPAMRRTKTGLVEVAVSLFPGLQREIPIGELRLIDNGEIDNGEVQLGRLRKTPQASERRLDSWQFCS